MQQGETSCRWSILRLGRRSTPGVVTRREPHRFHLNPQRPCGPLSKGGQWGRREELLLESKFDKYPGNFSRDGRFLIYYEVDPQTGGDLWVLPLAGDRKPFPFLKTKFYERSGIFSADGRWGA